MVGVAQASIANNAAGIVALGGYVALVNTTASVTRGYYGSTSTTVKKASAASSRAAGAFCQFLKTGSTPDAILFGAPDTSGGGTLAWSEVPSGTINGVNAVFTLAHAPIGLLLSKNGLVQRPGSGNDYTLSGSSVTFEAGNIPQTGDVLLASYSY